MSPLDGILKSIPRVLLTAVLLMVGLVAVFVAWWIALVLLLGLVLSLVVRGLLPRKPSPASGGGSKIIEGEFRIESEDPPSRDHSGS